MQKIQIIAGRMENQIKEVRDVAEELHNYGVYGSRYTSPLDPDAKPDKPGSRTPGRPEAFTKLRELEDEMRRLKDALAEYIIAYNEWLDLQQATESEVS